MLILLCRLDAFAPRLPSHQATHRIVHHASWSDLQDMLGDCYHQPTPFSIDSVLDSSPPVFSEDRPTLFRDRHGWCPYSERVWLALELTNIAYDTIRIDNTGGGRPSYFSGQTPQIRWPGQARLHGESMDLVAEIDRRYADGQLQSDSSNVQDVIRQFSQIFPRARPSSRAAFLFQSNGEPLGRSTFERTLSATNDLLAATQGPFFLGATLTAADLAWAPFLERYRYQLPCLHQDLEPDQAKIYPALAAWYAALDQVPAYAARIQGDAASWRKVLTMAGFGNAGLPPDISANLQERIRWEAEHAADGIRQDLWQSYAQTRPYLAATPAAEAAQTIVRNRVLILADARQRALSEDRLPASEDAREAALRGLTQLLLGHDPDNDTDEAAVGAWARFLDQRMCVPRDMGAMSAATIKLIALGLN